MKTTIRKYPLLISLIISCAIIIASLFVLGFAGMRMGTSLGGGSQMEIAVSRDASTKTMVSEIKSVLSENGLTFDSSTVESKYVAIDNEGNYTKEVLIVKISQNNISDEKEATVINQIAAKLNISADTISSIDNITAFATAKNVLMIGLAIGIIAIALFVFAWIRYDVFAGLAFIIAFLHNIILYLSLVIVTRLELNVASLVSIFILTTVMSIILIHIFEKYRTESRLHISDKLSISERMMAAEKSTIQPFVIVAGAAVVVLVFMLFIPALVVKFTALNILVALVVTTYTSLIVGPETYVALLEFIDVRRKAVLSRNDTVNKEIKKKIKRSQKAKEEALKAEAQKASEPVVEPEVVEEQPKQQIQKKKTTTKKTTKKTSKSKKR